MIRTSPANDAYRDAWDRIFADVARDEEPAPLSEARSADACPACGSMNTKPFEFGDDVMSRVLHDHYPDARECGACDFGWSPAREAEKQSFREMGFKLVQRKYKSQP